MTEQTRQQLRDVVRQAAAECPEIAGAVSLAIQRVSTNKNLLRACLGEIIEVAVRAELYGQRHRDRWSAKRTTRGAAAIAAASATAVSALLDTWPFLGKSLGDARP